MINTSNEYKQMIAQSGRSLYAKAVITLQSGESLEIPQKKIWGLVIEDDVSGKHSFDVGAAIVNQCTLKFDNSDGEYSGKEFDQAKIVVKVGLQLSETIEWLNKGTFTADPGDEIGSVITIKAYDNMKKFDFPYADSKLAYPATLRQIVQDACDMCGVSFVSPTTSEFDYVVQMRPDDESLTFREILHWVGQIACCWFRCNANGALTAGFYDVEAYEQGTKDAFHQIDQMQAFTRSTDDIVITGIRVVQETDSGEIVYQNGQTGYVLSVEGNELIQGTEGEAIAAQLGEKLIGLKFRKFATSHQSDPSIEAGDLVRLVDWKGNEYKSFITSTAFQLGGIQKTACNAETPSRNSSTRYSESTKTYVALRKLVRQEQTARETAVANLASALANSSGLYQTVEEQDDGSNIYYLHDKATLAESATVIKMTAEAIGASTDGGETYPYGFTVTGEMVTRLLAAEGVSADWITVGILQGIKIIATEGSIGNWNIYDGVLGSAYDKSGTWYGVALDARQECFDNNYNIFAVGQFDITNGGSSAKDAILGSWANAAFRIRADGRMTSTAGSIGGWEIDKNTLSGANGYLGMKMFAEGYTPEGSTDVFFVVFYKDGNRPVGGFTVEGWKSISV